MLKIVQKKSTAGRVKAQIDTLKALGLGKINSYKIHPDNEIVRGMIKRVSHIVNVEEVEQE
jgi:large subunit ribosomal protein L30